MNGSLNDSAGTSSGNPPACHTPRLTSEARSRRCVWHGLISLHVLTTAITGLPAGSARSKPICSVRDRCPKDRRSLTPYQRWLRSSRTVHDLGMDRETLDLLKQASTATISTQLLARGLRNTFLHGLKPLAKTRMAGPAFTLRYIPAREDIDTLDVYKDYDHPQRKAIETVPEGHVLVMDCRGQGRAASAGGILATRLQVRNAGGLVTDGTLRDTPEIERLENLAVYAQGPSPLTNLAQHHAVDLNVPIGCAEVAVYPGDIMVGDEEGVICIPAHLADEVAEAATEQEKLEAFIQREIASGRPLRGTYPPDEATRRRYHEQRPSR